MKENFDATQFITFDVSGECEYIINQILERFHNLGFEVLLEKDIRNVKRRYFSKYKKGIFMELKDDTFLGEIEFWKVDSEMPTERIKSFVEQLNWIYNQKEIYNLNLKRQNRYYSCKSVAYSIVLFRMGILCCFSPITQLSDLK